MKAGVLLLNYYNRLQHGEEPLAAFRAEFGDPAQLDQPFAAYIKAKALSGALAELPSPDATTLTIRTLRPVEVLDEEGVIRIESRDRAAGRNPFQRALRIDAHDALAHEELGVMDYGQGHLAQAREHWQAAAAADPTRFVSRFALVMTGTPLRQQSVEQRKDVLVELQQIVKLNPHFSPAFVRIAVLQWWQGNLDAAMRACAEAERLSPSRLNYHLLHARLLLAENDGKAAAAIVHSQSDRLATEDQVDDIGFSSDALSLWQSIPANDRGAASLPAAGVRAGSQEAQGRILNVECGDWNARTPFRMTMQANGGAAPEKLMLTAGNTTHVLFSDTVWIGGGHDPVCFAATGQPVYAIYKPGSKGYGELLDVELLDDLPTTPQP